MAKKEEAAGQRPLLLHSSPAPGAGEPVPAPVPAPVSVPGDSPELTRLRAQLAEQTARVAELEREAARARAAVSAASADAPGVYRVGLEGARVMRSRVTVAPRREDQAGVAPTAEYDGLALGIAAGGNPDLQTLAWQRYRSEHPGVDRRLLRIRVESASMVDTIDIPARSAYEARGVFERLNGIERTDAVYVIERLEGAPAGA